jgi:hypothetical protein
MQLRRFNSNGIETFREALAACRDNHSADIPMELLSSNELTSLVSPNIEVQPQPFKTKRDAARYFHEIFLPLPREQLQNDAGLWTWLSLLNFDVVCPKVNGTRKIRNDYTYIFEPRNSRNYYRHLLFVSWYILDIAPTFNRLMLNSSVSTLDKFTSDVAKRLYLTRIPCFFEVLDRLYWDESIGRARPGVTNFAKVTAGNLAHRLPVRIRQLEKTYDLLSLTADQLINLLGEEFQFGAESKHKQLHLSLKE